MFCSAFLLTAMMIDTKTLDGWHGLPGTWKVADGVITGSHDGTLKGNTFLVSKKTYKDFELSFQVRLKGAKANSGVQFRSEVLDKSKWSVKGPQADIGPGYWGSLYGEEFGGMMQAADESKVNPTLKPDGFNDYLIRVVGKKVTIKVNGVTTVDADFEKLPAEGVIGLQLHAGPGMEVVFREIRFKELK